MKNQGMPIKFNKLERELSGMCNLSEGIYRKGFEIGIAEGIEISYDNARIESLKNVMKNLKLSFDQAATAIGLSESEKSRYANKI
jgi:hypothetical protein